MLIYCIELVVTNAAILTVVSAVSIIWVFWFARRFMTNESIKLDKENYCSMKIISGAWLVILGQ